MIDAFPSRSDRLEHIPAQGNTGKSIIFLLQTQNLDLNRSNF
ncbi:MAG: hypothetical protein JWP25_5367 [Bradyrhizobium sp.]|jgi:hypothetical protein|nr:hypothetical protein [Bradyrhizobium sp.]MEA2869052.1 hypothetical protein [Bradyrhizobium sp.]